MAIQGNLVKASDLSAFLTADTVMSAIDIDALKQALNIGSGAGGGPKIVGANNGGRYGETTSCSIDFGTTDWDYLEITSYPLGDVTTVYDTTGYSDRYIGNAEYFTPMTSYINSTALSGSIPVRQYRSYTINDGYTYNSITNVSYSINGSIITFSGFSYATNSVYNYSIYTGSALSVVAYKNS